MHAASLPLSRVFSTPFHNLLALLGGALLATSPAALIILVLGAQPSRAQSTLTFGPISVPGNSVAFDPDNVYTATQLAAAGANGSLGATPAVEALAFAAAPGQVMIFSASGLVGCCSVANIGPDGYTSSLADLTSVGSISGYQGPALALVGVFTNGDPQGAPPGDYDYSQGFGQPTYAPELNQVFFIGDGLTGT